MEVDVVLDDGFQRAPYGFEYDFITPDSPHVKATLPASEPSPLDRTKEPEEPSYQFRLFASGQKSKDQPGQPVHSTTDIRVRLSATPEPAELAEALSLDKAQFVRPNRPELYYFTSAVSMETAEALKAQYEDAATSTADVLSRARSTEWPGTALPRRVIGVELLNKPPNSKAQLPNISIQGDGRARSRPSKKRRILFRCRLALREELAAQSKVAEKTEREKRTRRNREKKVKKKEREKRRKVDGNGDGTVAEDAIQPGKGRKEDEAFEKGIRPPLTEAGKSVEQLVPNGADTPKSGQPASSDPRGPETVAQGSPHPSAAEDKNLGTPLTRRAPTSRTPTAATKPAPKATRMGKARAPTSMRSTRPSS